MTGGVGKDERAKIEKMSGDYNLKIVLAAASGSYLAQVPITIYDSNGTQLFKAEAAGPWFYARLPEGRYTIKVNYRGKEKEKMVHMSKRVEVIIFHWKI